MASVLSFDIFISFLKGLGFKFTVSKGCSETHFLDFLFHFVIVGWERGCLRKVYMIAHPTSCPCQLVIHSFRGSYCINHVNSVSLFSNLILASVFLSILPIYRYISISLTVQWIFLEMELVRRRSPLWQQLATTNIHKNNMDKDTMRVMMAITG